MVQEDFYDLIIQQIGSENVNKISSIFGLPLQSTLIIIASMLLVLIIWSTIWKGLALWKAAKKDHKWWFVLILVANTAGIFEILYIYWISEIEWDKSKKIIEKKKKK